MPFLIVAFPNEHSVREVPAKWVDKRKLICLWPTSVTEKKLQKYITEEREPGPSWKSLQIKLCANGIEYDTFEQALENGNLALEETEWDDDVDLATTKKTNNTPADNMNGSSHSSKAGQLSDDSNPPRKRGSSNSKSKETDDSSGSSKKTRHETPPAASATIDKGQDLNSDASFSASTPSSRSKVRCRLENPTIKDTYDITYDVLRIVSKMAKTAGVPVLVSLEGPSSTETDVNLLLGSKGDIENMNADLKIPARRSYVKEKWILIGGDNARDMTQRILLRTFSDAACNEVTMKGHKRKTISKLKFMDSEIQKLLFETVDDVFPRQLTDNAKEGLCGVHFRNHASRYRDSLVVPGNPHADQQEPHAPVEESQNGEEEILHD